MAKAKITLTDSGPLTFSGNGYTFERGKSAIVTTDADIQYFRSQHGFDVQMMEGVAPKKGKPEVVSDDGDDETPPTGKYTRDILAPMTKNALIQLAEDEGYPKLDPTMNKTTMINAILDAAGGESSDDDADDSGDDDSDDR